MLASCAGARPAPRRRSAASRRPPPRRAGAAAGPAAEAEARFNVLRTSDFSAVIEVWRSPFEADAVAVRDAVRAEAVQHVQLRRRRLEHRGGIDVEPDIEAPDAADDVAGASSARPIGRAIGPVGRRPPGGATGGGSFSPTPGPMAAPTTGCAPVWRAERAPRLPQQGSPARSDGGARPETAAVAAVPARASAGAGAPPDCPPAPEPPSAASSSRASRSRRGRSAPLGSGATLSMSCLRENGPVRLPSSAMYQATPSSAGGSGRGAARRSIGAVAGGASGVRGTAGGGGRAAEGAPGDPTGETGADGRRMRRGTGAGTAFFPHGDDVRAGLAADLENLPADFFVRD